MCKENDSGHYRNRPEIAISIGHDFLNEHLVICDGFFTMNTMNTVLFIMIFEIAISRRFQAVSAGDRDLTMDYLNHTCGVAFR